MPSDRTHDEIFQEQPAGVAVTPYLNGLRHACDEELARQYGRHEKDLIQLDKELSEVRARSAPLAVDAQLADSRLTALSQALSDEELNRRGPAEQDDARWPAEMLRERRRRQRRIAREEAEETLRQTAAKMQVAALAVDHAQLTYNEHLRATRARGWQIVHHYQRREATYLRSLTRVHESGPGLVGLLELGDRQLPAWLLSDDSREDPDGER